MKIRILPLMSRTLLPILTSFLGASMAFALATPEGRITSPYDACKEVVILSKDKYTNNKEIWDKLSKDCDFKIQFSLDAGFTDADPLKEGAEYLNLSTTVAQQVLDTVKKNQQFAECTYECFSGNWKTCPATMSTDNKVVECTERKDNVRKTLSARAKELRLELALSGQSASFTQLNKGVFNDTITNRFAPEFPNPVGRTSHLDKKLKMTKEEIASVKESMQKDLKEIDEEYNKMAPNKRPVGLLKDTWTSDHLAKKRDEHRAKYLELIYEKTPVFAVIDQASINPTTHEITWTDKQISKAFREQEDLSRRMISVTEDSIKKGTLEFSRIDGKALTNWLASVGPKGDKVERDLAYFMTMKNQVEEVLKKDPTQCGAATTIYERLSSKGMQNMAVTVPAFIAGTVIGGAAVGTIAGITAANGAVLTSLGLSTTFWGEAYQDLERVKKEATSTSGLASEKETPLRKAQDIKDAQTNAALTVALLPLDFIGVKGAGKAIYNSLTGRMIKNNPGMSDIIKNGKLTEKQMEELVHKELGQQAYFAAKSGLLSDEEYAALKNEQTGKFLTELINKINGSNPDFFQDSNNLNFLFKLAAEKFINKPGDPKDLIEKATVFLTKLDPQALGPSWDPEAKQGLLKFFDATIDQLRKAKPDEYAKFGTPGNSSNDEKLLMRALDKAGVKSEADQKAMVACVAPRFS